MSPFGAVLCIALVSFASAGIIPSGRNGEYQLAVNYRSQQGLETSARQIVNQNDQSSTQNEAPVVEKSQNDPQSVPNNQANQEKVESSAKKSSDSGSENYSRQQQDATHPIEVSSESTPSSPLEPSSDSSSQPQNSPLAPQVASSAGSVSYAYHGQSQQSSSSRVSQTLTSNLQAFSGQPEVTHHYTELPAANVAFYHPEELHSGAVVTVAHPATAYLHPERSQVVATHSAILGPSTVTTYQTAPATIAHFTAVQPPPRPVSEQSFSVNVASAKYGYGYTVRGVQHAH